MTTRAGRIDRGRWFLRRLAMVALIGIAAGAVLWRGPWRTAPLTGPSSPGPLQSVEKLRTSIYHDDMLMLRVSAGAVTVRRPHVLGPFRLGVMRAVEARDLTVETFEPSGGQRTSTGSAVKQAVTALLPERLRKTIARAEVERAELIHHGADGSAVRITANHCDSGFAGDELVCRHGILRDGATETRFQEAVFDAAGRCRLDGKLYP